jgi:hypothetical protein
MNSLVSHNEFNISSAIQKIFLAFNTVLNTNKGKMKKKERTGILYNKLLKMMLCVFQI